MADDQESSFGPYRSDDEQYAGLISNLLNPPAAGPAGVTPTAPMPAAAPARPPAPSPAGVTRSGDPSTQKSKSWADYVRGSLDAATAAQGKSQTAMDALQSQSSVASQNTPLEQQRAQLAQPIDPNQAQYKPGIGTRIVRGIDAFRRGGVLGAVDPADVGGQAYGAPTRQYGIDTARQQQKVGALDAQMKENIDTNKADSDRLGKIGTDQRASATTALDIGKTATAQQNAEDKSDQNAALDKIRQENNDLKANKLPNTFESAAVAAAMEQDPRKKAALNSAVQQMRDMEIKKFTYAARATAGRGPNDGARQPIIDAATAKINKLNGWQYSPEDHDGKGGWSDPASPLKSYTTDEFVAMKNAISTTLDKDLATKRLQPLGVRFNANDTLSKGGAQAPAAAAQTAPKQAPQPAQAKAPTRQVELRGPGFSMTIPESEAREGRVAIDEKGRKWVVKNGTLELQKPPNSGK